MKIQDKHILALDDQSYLENKYTNTINQIKLDDTSSCWDIENVFKYAEIQLSQYKNLTKDEKLKMPFYGLTVGVKDLFMIKGLKTTAGSKILEDFKSPYDSHMWDMLKNKGSLLMGKLSMDEFAMGSFTNTSYLNKTTLPNFPDRTAGGSSGGSGASLASKLFDFTIGSDTGGSVRLPASFCSVVGYKPSYGAFSRYGMISYASSLDQAGFLTQDIEDLDYIIKNNMGFKDSRDATQIGLGEYEVIKKTNYKIGYFPEIIEDDGITEEVKKAYIEEINSLKNLGITLKPIKIELMKKAVQIYYIIACSEASSNLARYQGIYYGKKLIDENFEGSFWDQASKLRSKYFGIEVQKRIMLGNFILSSENFSSIYEKAKNMRFKLTQDLNEVLEDLDAMILPTAPMVSPKWDDIKNMTSSQIYMADFLTVPFSLAGLPSISMPSYKNELGLGIGIQWVGKKFKDYQLIKDIKDIKG